MNNMNEDFYVEIPRISLSPKKWDWAPFASIIKEYRIKNEPVTRLPYDIVSIVEQIPVR